MSDGWAVDEIRPALGFTHLVTFEKHCVNYSFRAAGRDIMATVVTVPELEGTFIEVETMARTVTSGRRSWSSAVSWLTWASQTWT